MLLATSELKKIINDISRESISSDIRGASIDLSIGETAKIPIENSLTINLFEDVKIDDNLFKEVDLTKGYELKPNKYIYSSTSENVSIPEDKAGILLPRSQFARGGLILPMSMYANPGYKGKLPIVIYNASPFTYIIPPYFKVMQLLIVELSGEAIKYGEQNNAKYHNEQKHIDIKFDQFMYDLSK